MSDPKIITTSPLRPRGSIDTVVVQQDNDGKWYLALLDIIGELTMPGIQISEDQAKTLIAGYRKKDA